METMVSLLRTELDSEEEIIRKQVIEYFGKLRYHQLDNAEYIRQTSLEFCKKQTLKKAMIHSVDLLQDCSFDEISKVINDALKLGADSNFGYDYITDFEERYKIKHRHPVTTGFN